MNSIINKKKIFKKDWTIPIILNTKKRSKIELNEIYLLKYKNKIVGKILINDIFKIDKKRFCQRIFNTTSLKHPFAKKIFNLNNLYVGGKVSLLKKFIPRNKDFALNKFKKINKLKNSIVFTSRNICHLGHQHLHQYILDKRKK